MVRRVGIIGYGNLGRFLASKIRDDDNFELAFVWNRTKSSLSGINADLILDDIAQFDSKCPDLVVEVAHPKITKEYGKLILKKCDYMIGSPTALCNEELLQSLKDSATEHGVYVPSGAFWGSEDIRKIDEVKQLRSLCVTMTKHPSSLKLVGHLRDLNQTVRKEAVTLFQGPVRDVCPLAPNNTNTMAVGAIAASNLGFNGVTGCLISDPSLSNYHIVQIEAHGFPKEDGSCFYVNTIRKNPAAVGEVTGQATYTAYFGSLKRARGKGAGIHLC